jgi:hypothetical protein
MSLAPYASGTPPTLDTVSPPLQPFVVPAADVRRRLQLAKGLVPVPPDKLVPAQLFLAHDADPPVKSAARESLTGMPAELLQPVLGTLADAALVDTALRVLVKQQPLVTALLLNTAVADDTVRWLAGSAPAGLCEVIGRNQVRCLRTPAIIEALYLNPLAPQGVVTGLLELAVRENLALDHIAGFREMRATLQGEEPEEQGGGLTDAEFASALLLASGLGQTEAEAAVTEAEAAAATGDEPTTKQSKSLQALILKMSVSQKVRMATVGDAAVRKLLIRDPKKMVALAVLKSPRLTPGEVAAFATNKAMNEELLATIARNKNWTKDYATRRALVFNPKTPLTFAMSFLRTLTSKDVKDCASSRDVSQTVARAAKRMVAGAQ